MARGENSGTMPDLSAMLIRRTVGSLESGVPRCQACHRTPLPGERMHATDGGRTVCDLCVATLPHADRGNLRSERVHASERPLVVAPRAA